MRIIWLTVQFIFGGMIFLGAAAEVASHVLDHGSFWVDTVRNVRSLLEPANPPETTTETSSIKGQCLRYEKRVVDMRCEDMDDPSERFLCKITIPPAEPVCVEWAPPG